MEVKVIVNKARNLLQHVHVQIQNQYMVHISELHDWLSRNSEAEEYNVNYTATSKSKPKKLGCIVQNTVDFPKWPSFLEPGRYLNFYFLYSD